jgi:hypothetical protein
MKFIRRLLRIKPRPLTAKEVSCKNCPEGVCW